MRETLKTSSIGDTALQKRRNASHVSSEDCNDQLMMIMIRLGDIALASAPPTSWCPRREACWKHLTSDDITEVAKVAAVTAVGVIGPVFSVTEMTSDPFLSYRPTRVL